MAAHPAASLRYKIAAHPGRILELQDGRRYYTTLYTGTEDLKYQDIDQSVRMNVKPEAGRCLVDGTTRESRKHVTGQHRQVGQCFMHNCHHRPSALKKSIAFHKSNKEYILF